MFGLKTYVGRFKRLFLGGTEITATAAELNKAGKKQVSISLGAVNATTSCIAMIAPFAGSVTGFKVANKDAIALDTNNYWEFKLTNKGTTGTASVTMGVKDTKTASGTALVAYTPLSIPLTGNATLAAGDLLLLTLTKGGTAQATAEALAQIEYSPS